jgi:hypothetical protein
VLLTTDMFCGFAEVAGWQAFDQIRGTAWKLQMQHIRFRGTSLRRLFAACEHSPKGFHCGFR